MIFAGTGKSVGTFVMHRAHKYERLALNARQNPTLVLMGYTVGTLFVFLGILDVLSTNWALSVGAYEVNAFMRKIMEYTGDFWIIPKLVFQCSVAAMIVWSPNRATIGIMTVMCAWTSSVVTNNFIIAYSLSMA